MLVSVLRQGLGSSRRLTSDENGDVANDEIRPIGIDALVNAFVVLGLDICAQIVSVGSNGCWHRPG